MNALLPLLLSLALLLSACGGSSGPTVTYHCPMHPTFITAGKAKCSICGMDLVVMDPSRAAAPAAEPVVVAGRVAVSIAPEQLRRIGLVTAPVRPHSVTNTLRLAATVDFDETRRAVVAPRLGGYVEELLVNAEGLEVRAGQPLFRLHSPMVRAAQIDLLEAAKINDARLIDASRTRLRLWGMAEAQIDAVLADGRPGDTFDYLSPAGGRVIRSHLRRGQAFMEGMTLYELADLSSVWIRAFAPESALARLRPGQPATLAVPALDGRRFHAAVASLAPALDPAARSLEIRLDCPNPDGRLRPGMWGELEVETGVETGLAVPASACIDTGARVIVFVDHGDGDLEPRGITAGARGRDFWMVRDGLVEGESVVTRALFLVDAESQIQAAMLAPAPAAAP